MAFSLTSMYFYVGAFYLGATMKKILILSVCLFILGGCSNPKNIEIPTDSEKWSDLKSSVEKLNPEEQQLLTQFMVRKKMGEAFGGEGIKAGTTIGDAIQEQKDWQKQKEAQEKAEAELKAKVEAQKKAKIAEINKILTVALTKKEGFSSFGGNNITDIGLEVAFENKGSKDIAGIKGVAHFNDMFGDNIQSINISYDDGVKANSVATYSGSVNYNQFQNEDKKLLNTELSKIKFNFEPQVILFADGSKLEVKDNP